jgi:hypothetical protein
MVRRILVLVAALAATLALVPAAQAAQPADQPGPYGQAQVGVGYTVYAPTFLAGLRRTSFDMFECVVGGDESIDASYAKGRRTLQLFESPKPCQDGPDSVGPVTTFTVKGAKVTVLGECAGGASTCASSTFALFRRNGYTTVTLPAASGLSSTFVEVYTTGLTVAEVRRFLNGLRPVL